MIYDAMQRVLARYARLSMRQKCLAVFIAYASIFGALSLATRVVLLLTHRSIVWQYDSSGEYYTTTVYAIRAIRELLRGLPEGRIAFDQYSFSLGLGNDVISSLNFYGLGDLVVALCALLPTDNTEFLFTFGVYLRQFLSGLFFYLYMRHMGVRRGNALVGAISFAFCGFVSRNTLRHQNFLVATVYLPLVLLGYERLHSRKRPALLILAVAMLAMSSFYFLYMISLFLFCYASFRFFKTYEPGQRKRAFWPVFARSVLCYLAGICMAGIILLPTLYGYFHSARVPEPLQLNLLFHAPLSYLSRLSRLVFPVNVNFEAVSIWAFFAAVALLMHPRMRKKVASPWLLLLVALYLLVPFIPFAFNGFAYISNRSYFLLSFLFSCALSVMIKPMLRMSQRYRIITSVIMVLMFGGFVYTILDTKDMNSKWAYYAYIAVMMCQLVGLVWLLFYASNPIRIRKYRWLPLAVGLVAVIANLGTNEIMYSYWRYQSGQMITAGKVDKAIASSPAASVLALGDDDFYRIEIPGRELSVRNEAMVMGFNPTACYLSMQNDGNLTPQGALENSGRVVLHYTTGFDGRAALLSAMGVKYFATRADSPQMPPYGFEKVEESANHIVYRNRNALPIAYTTHKVISRADYDALDALSKQQALIGGAVLKDAKGLEFAPMDLDYGRQSIEYAFACSPDVEWEDGRLHVKRADAEMTLTFSATPNSETYLRLCGVDIDGAPYEISSIEVSGEGFKKEIYTTSNTIYEYNYGATNYLANLGYHETGLSQATLVFKKAGTVDLRDIELYCLPMGQFDRTISALGEVPVHNLTVRNGRIEGDVNLPDDRAVVLSVPYSGGWRAEVDGASAAIDRGADMNMVLALGAGQHRFVLTYENPWLKFGLALSAAGIASAIALCWYWAVRRGRGARRRHLG